MISAGGETRRLWRVVTVGLMLAAVLIGGLGVISVLALGAQRDTQQTVRALSSELRAGDIDRRETAARAGQQADALRDLLSESATREGALGTSVNELIERLATIETVLVEVRAAATAARDTALTAATAAREAGAARATVDALLDVQVILVAEVERLRQIIAELNARPDAPSVVIAPPPGAVCRVLPALC